MIYNHSTRRDVLRLMAFSAVAGASSLMLPHRLLASTSVASSGINWNGTLILIKLDGGNDGLNTLIPYTDPLYQSARPTVALPKSSMIPLNGSLALNSALQPLMTAWSAKDMQIALGVGYPDMSGMDSHFLSSDIWGTATVSYNTPSSGWITQFLQQVGPTPGPADAAVLGSAQAEAVGGTTIRTAYNPGSPVTTLLEGNVAARVKANPVYAWMVEEQSFVDSMAASLPNVTGFRLKNTFPATGLGANLATAAQLILSGSKIPIISLTLSTFDTHTDQQLRQTPLLQEFASALAVFRQEMIDQGQWQKVLVVTHSEFGRSMYENSGGGTDHGKANTHFILGGNVRGQSFIGNQLPLSSVTEDANGIRALEYQLDFRQIYATIMQSWWQAPSSASTAVLGLDANGQAFNPLPILNS